MNVESLRRFMNWLAALGAGAGLLSLAWYSVTGRPYRFIVLNSLIAIFMLLAIALVVVIPGLSRNYLVIQSRVLRVVLPAIALAIVFSAGSRALGHAPPAYLVPVELTVWILALGYVAVQRTFAN